MAQNGYRRFAISITESNFNNTDKYDLAIFNEGIEIPDKMNADKAVSMHFSKLEEYLKNKEAVIHGQRGRRNQV